MQGASEALNMTVLLAPLGDCERYTLPSVTNSVSPVTGRLVRVADAEQLDSALRRDASYVIITAHLQASGFRINIKSTLRALVVRYHRRSCTQLE